MNPRQPEDNDSQHPGRDATLIPFPSSAGEPADAAPEVLDGEVLSDEENATVARRLLGRGVNRVRPRVGVLARAVVQHPRTAQVKAVAGYRLRKAPRDVTRLCWFALRGHGRWITKAWTYTTHGDLRADARAARLAGDQEARRVLSVVDFADDGVIEVAGDRAVRTPRPLVAGVALVGSVTGCSAW